MEVTDAVLTHSEPDIDEREEDAVIEWKKQNVQRVQGDADLIEESQFETEKNEKK